ncbi:Plasmodium exported protein (hyp10), unknown function [Plasmodium sp. gorilla clade G2]|uniref:Plasmodium exported protein (hyp10), unknown function n=1 Tax=Plasmodium sp. gorilla clade G2 TaxID=880535 RepID=UPI000D22BE01|nr:Plasmodium exported protein (hyp10), unknown function [Plasmodium sp. gorilla clade G2]SOV10296.1 Plasmodium exported protein (hyp10), unknown function [Plasmodium sp. gorilla clade G2]
MSCNYFKLSLFSIVLCILIITHKFSFEKISHNKTNMDYLINTGHIRLLAEAQETDIFKTTSGENSLTYPIDTKLEENITEYHKTSSDCTLNNEIREEHDNQTEQVELENEYNNKSLSEKSHKKKHCKRMKNFGIISILLAIPFLFICFSPYYYKNRKNKKSKNINNNNNSKNKENEKNIHEDQVSVEKKI